MKLATEHVYTLLIAAVAATLVLTLPAEPKTDAGGPARAPIAAAADQDHTPTDPAPAAAPSQEPGTQPTTPTIATLTRKSR